MSLTIARDHPVISASLKDSYSQLINATRELTN